MSLQGNLVSSGGLPDHGTASHVNQGNPGTYTTPFTVVFDAAGAENGVYKVYQAGVTYGNNDITVGSDSLVYISQVAGNVGNDPTLDTTGTNWRTLRNWTAEPLTSKAPCRVATTANITLSGTQTIDGIAVVAGNRVLVKSQTSASANGIYVCASGAWTRSTDFDTTTKVYTGIDVRITEGTANQGSWFLSTTGVITVGTTALTFTQATGASGAVNFADAEVATGLINSANTTYLLAHTPNPALSLHSYLNGQRLTVTTDYTLATATVTMTTAPVTGDTLFFDYRY